MGINLPNFLLSKLKNKKMLEYQDLDHIEWCFNFSVCANLYKNIRDDLVMFYFRDRANYASRFTVIKNCLREYQVELGSKFKKIYSLLVNARNANCLQVARI